MCHASAQTSLGAVSIPDAHALSSVNGWEVAHLCPCCAQQKMPRLQSSWSSCCPKGEKEEQTLRSFVFPSPVHIFDISAQE